MSQSSADSMDIMENAPPLYEIHITSDVSLYLFFLLIREDIILCLFLNSDCLSLSGCLFVSLLIRQFLFQSCYLSMSLCVCPFICLFDCLSASTNNTTFLGQTTADPNKLCSEKLPSSKRGLECSQ